MLNLIVGGGRRGKGEVSAAFEILTDEERKSVNRTCNCLKLKKIEDVT